MDYIGKLSVSKDVAIEMERLVREPWSSRYKAFGIEFDEEVVFSNGYRMAIQVCAPCSSPEPCWTQGVLFDSEGTELGCTPVGESFEGDYRAFNGDDSYVVKVEANVDTSLRG